MFIKACDEAFLQSFQKKRILRKDDPMSGFRIGRAFAVLFMATAALACPLMAGEPKGSDERSEWEPILRQQVKGARSCDLKEILFANIMDLGKQRVLEGRLRCSDGREFTFTRKHEHQKFDFELCEPAVC